MSEFNDIIKDKKPTLVDFYATWCGPCKMMHPILEQLKEKVGDSVTIVKIDVDKNQELAQSYHVRSVPTLIIFGDGEMKWRAAGVHTADDLEAKLKEYM
ncbi:thioredoxin [uncultured Muribaculum sp.]|uniref:thioredoxin n=1 Tax=uncultured Muribaculum sp. TaxID=1918613 RepID=UPI0025EECCF8|nr:thioredoxin [uncultured Muribaculum sp.]